MAIELAKAYVQIVPTTEGIQGELNDVLSSAGEEAGKKGGAGMSSGIGSALKGIGKVALAGIGAAAAGVTALTKASVDSYASYEQLTGGVEKLYGTAADQVMEFAQEAYKTAGLSANAYMETATGFSAALVGSLGGDVEKAAQITDVAMRAMSDNVNVFGSDFGSIQTAFQGFAKQNYTMLDNLKLGYGGTKTEMERLIADANAYRASIGETSNLSINSFADVVLAIQSVQEAQNIAGTTGREAMTTIEGSASAAKAAWANLMTTIATGEGIDTAIDALLTTVFGGEEGGGLLNNLLPRIEGVLSGISDFIATAAPILAPKIGEMITSLLPGILEAGVALIKEIFPVLLQLLISLLPQIIAILPDLISSLVTTFIENMPQIISAVLLLIAQLTAALFEAAGKIFTGIGDILRPLGEWIWNNVLVPIGNFFSNIWEGVKNTVSNAWEGIKNGAKSAWEGIKNVFSSVANWFGDIFSTAWQKVKDVFSTGGRIFEGIKEGIASVFTTVVNAIIRGINWVVALPFNAINTVLDQIRGITILGIQPFSWVGSIAVPQIPELATGTVATSPMLAMIGEDGDEAVVPLERNTGWIRRVAEELSEYAGSETQNITINVYPSEGMDERALAKRIGEILGAQYNRARAVYG